MARAVKRETIARALGVSGGRVSQLKGQGMPTDSVDAAKAWYAEHVDQKYSPKPPARTTADETDIFESRAKRERHEADIAEMRSLEMAGRLVDADRVRRLFADAGAAIRLSLERLPDKLAPRLVAETDERAIHQLISAEIDATLTELTRVRV